MQALPSIKHRSPEQLPPGQRAVYDFICRWIKLTGTTPTIREIAAELGFKSPNGACYHLRALEDKGFITRMPGRARSIALNHGPGSLPILGTVEGRLVVWKKD